MSKIAISDMAAHYRKIRKAVYERGTEPYHSKQQQHYKNKDKLKNHAGHSAILLLVLLAFYLVPELH